MTKLEAAMKEELKSFFDDLGSNVDWDWDSNGGPRVLVDEVFDLDALSTKLAERAETELL